MPGDVPGAAPLTRAELEHASGAEVRAAIRDGRWTGTTKRMALGREQANLTILPERYAFDFLRFCHRNPKPLPLLDVTDPGDPEPALVAPGADLRTDVAAYRIYRDGVPAGDVADLLQVWRPDHVAFLTGCNLSLDQVMLDTGIPLPHLLDEHAWPAQYVSSIPCRPAGAFHGTNVVSMRPVPEALLVKVIELTARFPRNHGAPLHVGDPRAIGITDLARVDWGRPNRVGPGTVPVFFACGITAQAVAMAARIPEMITHVPGRMFVTDVAVVDPTPGWASAAQPPG